MTEFGGRKVIIISANDIAVENFTSPFAALVTASNRKELDEILGIAASLIKNGCQEFCCVGADSELLHDELDHLIESAGFLDIATTWHNNTVEGCEYFLYAAGGQGLTLIAIIAQHPDLLKSMELAAEQSSGL